MAESRYLMARAVRQVAPAFIMAALAAAVAAQVQAEAPPPAAPEPAVLVTDIVAGIGDEALPGMVVIVHYTGWLHDPAAQDQRGRKFDSSHDRRQPLSFTLGAGRVIRGWDQGLPGMRIGGTRRLVIPPSLAYGSRGTGNGAIPPNATLVFDVELLAVETVTLRENK
jgi:FKBP-type peptidyl-prolyl cis-trans isomerase FkpA